MSNLSAKEIALLHNQICTCLCHPRRMQIIYALYNNEGHNVSALAELLDMPQSSVSRHLAILRQRWLVEATREGQSVIYRITDERVIQTLDTLRAILKDLLEQAS